MEQSFPQCKTILWCLYVCKVNMHIVYNVTYPFGHLSTLCIKKWQLNCWIIELVTFFQFPLGCVTNETFLSCNINIQMILVVVSIKQTITTKLLLRNSPYVLLYGSDFNSPVLCYLSHPILFWNCDICKCILCTSPDIFFVRQLLQVCSACLLIVFTISSPAENVEPIL